MLSEYVEKVFPTGSNSLKGTVSNNFLRASPPKPLFLFPQNYENIFPLHFTFARVTAYD